MSDHASSTGSVPGHHDRTLGPVILAGYAADLALHVAAHSLKRVLEIAAGTALVAGTGWSMAIGPLSRSGHAASPIPIG